MSNQNNDVDALPKVEPTEPTTIKELETNLNNLSLKPKDEKLSKTDLITKKINEILDDGRIQLTDKSKKLELNKLVRDELQLSKGWSSDINKIIKNIAVDKKLQISDLGFKNDKIGDVTVNLVKSEPEPQDAQVQANIKPTLPQSTPQSPHGTLPKGISQGSQTETLQESEKKYMSESAQKKLISHGLTKMIFPLYASLGLIELDDDEIKEQAKIKKGKKAKEEFEELATDIDEYLTENNIKLPALLNHLSIIISVFVVLVLPVIKFKFFTTKQEPNPEYDESADTIKVDV